MNPKRGTADAVVRGASSSEDIRRALCGAINYGFKQKDLAKYLGVSMAYLSDLLRGKRNIGPTILKKLGYDPTPYYLVRARHAARGKVKK